MLIGGVASARRSNSSRRCSASAFSVISSIYLIRCCEPMTATHTPHFPISHMPADEQDKARDLLRNLSLLGNFHQDFVAGVELMAFTQQKTVELLAKREGGLTPEPVREAILSLSRWAFIAARDAAMSLFHFGTVSESIQACVARCPSIAKHVSHRELALCGNAFQTQFADWGPVRHSVAHQGDWGRDRRKISAHATDKAIETGIVHSVAGNSVYMSGSLAGNAYSCTVNGKVAQLEISGTSASALGHILQQFYHPFEKATPAITEEYVESLRAPREQAPKG